MNALVLSNDEELKKLSDRLVSDIIDAGGHARCPARWPRPIRNTGRKSGRRPVSRISRSQGLREACLMRLARIYNQDHHSLSFLTLPNAIGHHTHFFEDDAVLRRVNQGMPRNLNRARTRSTASG